MDDDALWALILDFIRHHWVPPLAVQEAVDALLEGEDHPILDALRTDR